MRPTGIAALAVLAASTAFAAGPLDEAFSFEQPRMPARAWISVGPAVGLTIDPDLVGLAGGIEVSGGRYFGGRDPIGALGVGGFFQAQWDAGGPRLCGGAQLQYSLFGVEVGLDAPLGRELAFHAAPFVSVGFATLSFRATAPVSGGAPSYAVWLTLKWPYVFRG